MYGFRQYALRGKYRTWNETSRNPTTIHTLHTDCGRRAGIVDGTQQEFDKGSAQWLFLEKFRISAATPTADKTLAELTAYENGILCPLPTQQVNIDLDDGVKVNYAKFGRALRNIPGLRE